MVSIHAKFVLQTMSTTSFEAMANTDEDSIKEADTGTDAGDVVLVEDVDSITAIVGRLEQQDQFCLTCKLA